MTRKDYILIAAAVEAAHSIPGNDFTESYNRGVDATARFLATALGRDNPRFDRERFLRAAGVVS